MSKKTTTITTERGQSIRILGSSNPTEFELLAGEVILSEDEILGIGITLISLALGEPTCQESTTRTCDVRDGNYGTCNEPLNHATTYHRETRNGRVWAEWTTTARTVTQQIENLVAAELSRTARAEAER